MNTPTPAQNSNANELQNAREWAQFFQRFGLGRKYANDAAMLAHYREVSREAKQAEQETDEWFQNEGIASK